VQYFAPLLRLLAPSACRAAPAKGYSIYLKLRQQSPITIQFSPILDILNRLSIELKHKTI
jgi:hypothetical protein